MMKCTQTLMNEHQLILQKLDNLRRFLETLNQDNLNELNYYFEFIQNYADKFHHAKEEDIYFKWMVSKHASLEMGPIACMLSEHNTGRDLVELAKKQITKQYPDISQIQHNLNDFITLLREHINKEDNILYSMAEELDQVEHDGDALMFKQFQDTQDKFKNLVAKYEVSHSCCGSCH